MNRDLEANRLTEADREQITTRVSETLRVWRHQKFGPLVIDAVAFETLQRIAHNSIGCESADLRDSELAKIECICRRLGNSVGEVTAS